MSLASFLTNLISEINSHILHRKLVIREAGSPISTFWEGHGRPGLAPGHPSNFSVAAWEASQMPSVKT